MTATPKRDKMKLINHDADAAKEIVTEDDEVDNLYDQVFRELLTFMVEVLKLSRGPLVSYGE
jgi:phosphate uptake regulator